MMNQNEYINQFYFLNDRNKSDFLKAMDCKLKYAKALTLHKLKENKKAFD